MIDFRKDSSQPSRGFLLTQPVYFIGFMGAGKTSVSRRLARKCHITSIDIDAYIERSMNMTTFDIFNTHGEQVFRDFEMKTLDELSTREPSLVSCGGGIVLREENRAVLSQRGYTVYLKVSVEEAAGRIDDISTRPLFNDIESANKIIASRLPLYEEVADVVIDTAGKSVNRISSELQSILLKEGILCQTQK